VSSTTWTFLNNKVNTVTDTIQLPFLHDSICCKDIRTQSQSITRLLPYQSGILPGTTDMNIHILRLTIPDFEWRAVMAKMTGRSTWKMS